MRRELELCVETLEAVEAAVAGGADRIELCAALGEGGVTPSRALLTEALHLAGALPVHVLVRPRAGGFRYSAAEHRVLCADVEEALAGGAAGVVVGVLTAERAVDQERTAELVRLASGREVTFHRAFDQTADPAASLEVLIGLGCSRVLTSGGQATVTAGLPVLKALVSQAAGRLRVAAGGGVTLETAPSLVRVPGLDLHASLRSKRASATAADPLWTPEPPPVSADAVRALRQLLDGAAEGAEEKS